MTMTNEQDVRLRLLNTLLTTPHRKLDEIWPVHADMVKTDPRFYVRLAAWYADHGDVRDHKEMFVITLALSEFAGHRDVGLAMLREMPPYEVVRVLDFVHGRKKTRKVVERVRAQRPARERRRGVVGRVVDAISGRAQNPAETAGLSAEARGREATEPF